MALDLQQIECVANELTAENRQVTRDTQHKLDISTKSRSNAFPWKGQFSPQLIEFLLSEHSLTSARVFDPFCGSGTVLAESAARNFDSFGFDINPGAYIFAKLQRVAMLTYEQRRQAIHEAEYAVFGSYGDGPSHQWSGSVVDRVTMLRGVPVLIASAVLMIAHGNASCVDISKLRRAFDVVYKAVFAMPYTTGRVQAFLRDSRNAGVVKESVDLVITSPPYINVLNYHQNYRPILQQLGWEPLAAAAAEIGANRKFRQNRFKTVVQYSIDMALILAETRRILKPDGCLVMVVGKCSSVRRVSFPNGLMISIIATLGVGFELDSWRERRFLNRYGEIIVEDVLTFRPAANWCSDSVISLGRLVGKWALQSALHPSDESVLAEMRVAFSEADLIQESPEVQVKVPIHYTSDQCETQAQLCS